MADNRIKFDMSGFKDLERQLKKDYKVKIGILGSQAAQIHKGEGKQSLTNAQIGAIHEQPDNDGTKIPRRSFLEEPLKENLYTWIKDNKRNAMKSIEKGKIREFFIAMAAEAENIVDEAFATNGYNTGTGWKPLSAKTLKREQRAHLKKRKTLRTYQERTTILTLTGQLRRSITSKVISDK